MTKHVKTAIIPVAGYGTRRLPITKAIEKCMLPIGNRPVVDYVVAECAAAGLEHIIFVVGENAAQLQTYYGHNRGLEEHLTAKGKTKELEMIRGTARGINISYIIQPADGPYGTAVPVQLAASHLVGEEAFAMMAGDAFVYASGGKPVLAEAVKAYEPDRSDHVMFCTEVPKKEASHYGVVRADSDGKLESLLEKPSQAEISDPALINVNCFIFNRSIFEHLESYMGMEPPKQNKGEHYLTDVLKLARDSGQMVKTQVVQGEYLDAGNVASWLKANKLAA